MVNEIPKWLKSSLDKAGAERIEAAVRKAEKLSSAEIVTVLVGRSTVSSHSPLIGALLLILLTISVKHFWHLISPVVFPESMWGLALVSMGLVGYGLSQWAPIERLLIPRREQQAEAERRALLAFYAMNLNATSGRTGILLFLSFFERRAIVLADQGIAQYCEQEIFNEVVQDLIRGAKQRKIADGFEQAIDRCGLILQKYFPQTKADKNELADPLRISWS